jgi:hypothetical protein
MAQSDFGTIVPSTKSGSALAADLNAWRDAVHSGHRGATRPSYVQAGMTWVQEVSGTTWRLYLYDGAQDILMGTFNPVLDTFTVSLGANSVPASAIAGGVGSGLNADQVDGLHATSFVRTDASSQILFGYSVRFNHPNMGSVNDGEISARLHDKGLNIVGIASEANDSQRYITMWGAVNILGSLSFSGGLAAYAEISGYARIKAYDGAVQAVMGIKGSYPALTSYNTLAANNAGYGWSAYTGVNNNLYFSSNTSENATGGTPVAWIAPNGEFGGAPYGNGGLAAYFARRPTDLGEGPWRDTGAKYNCGEYNCNMQKTEGYEVYDVGNGQHKVRRFGGIDLTFNCSSNCPTNCSSSCFPGETLVTLESGATIPISEVRVGDILLGGFGYRNTVLAIDKTRLGARPLKVINGYHRFTAEHRHVSPTGWVSIDRDATMAEHNQWFDVIVDNAGTVAPRQLVKFTKTPILPLEVGTQLLRGDGYLIESVKTLMDDWTRGEQEEVYSLVMDGSHTFLANGFIVSGWARDDDFDYAPWFSVGAAWR